MANLDLGGIELKSRLIVGTGKFSSNAVMKAALDAAAQMVTVSVRRMDFTQKIENILDYIDLNKFILLCNTAGAKAAPGQGAAIGRRVSA